MSKMTGLLLQACDYRCCSCLSCYVYIFAISIYLTRVKQCLTIFFFQKLWVIGKISIRWSEKRHQTNEKVEIWKKPTVNPLFNKYLFIHNKFLNEKWVNRRHFFIDEKNLQKLGVTGELLSVYSYYMMIRSFYSQVLVLKLIK